MDRPAPGTIIARQAVAQTYKNYSPQRLPTAENIAGNDYGPQIVSDILSGRYDFSTDMIVAKATVKLTLELSDRTPR